MDLLILPPFLFFFFILFCSSPAAASTDTLTQTESLPDGELLVSKSGKYALGFFSPGRTTNRYLGIWFLPVPEQTVVWVANRNTPIAAGGAALTFNSTSGDLVLRGGDRNVSVWSTGTKIFNRGHPPIRSAKLLDSGNFMLLSADNSTILWQSFDYPTNTVLPGAKLGLDKRTGLDRFLTAWRSEDDPGTGSFTFRVDPSGSPQFFLYKNGTPYSRSNPWPWGSYGELFEVEFVNDEFEASFTITLNDDSVLLLDAVDYNGVIREKIWREGYGGWKEYWSSPTQKCDLFGRCGKNGLCDPSNVNTFECSCLLGYVTRSPRSWHLFDGSGGCVRKKNVESKLDLDCGEGDGFVRVQKVKAPDSSKAVWIEKKNGWCEVECRKNCSCSAYAEIDAGKEKGCLLWFGDLVDTVYYPGSDQDLYVRVDEVEFANYRDGSNNVLELKLKLSIVLPSIAALWLVLTLFGFLWLRRWRSRTVKKRRIRDLFHPTHSSNRFKDDGTTEEIDGDSVYPELPFFSLSTIRAATEDFAPANQLGRGGFGSVYKDSRFRIIHRDLKTSNILLDAELNPKISDFGLATVLEVDQVHGKTSSVGGTYGYMSPEYAVFGRFSEKSDVFSFGVVLLETVTGKKISTLYRGDENLSLIGHVWELWNEDRALEAVDSSMEGSYDCREVMRCIHIGLLCLEENVVDRPNMLTTVLMLNTAMPVPDPKQPAFTVRSCYAHRRDTIGVACSINDVTLTDVTSR
ncbi:G-type lectin S-receptor-like serine/threonine-protein kinase At1g11410 [Linum grandiflorum]